MDATHARRGPPTRQWEDLLVELKGPMWREIRDRHVDYAAWKRTTDVWINELCTLWDLPILPIKEVECSIGADEHKDDDSKLKWPLSEIPFPLDRGWEDQSGRVLFVVDSQSVEQVAIGRAALQNQNVRPLFVRLVDTLQDLVKPGGAPRAGDDPVQWRPRKYN